MNTGSICKFAFAFIILVVKLQIKKTTLKSIILCSKHGKLERNRIIKVIQNYEKFY